MPLKSGGMYKVPHIRQKIPRFEVPQIRGRRYDDMIPDTLDIQERISLAVNGLTGPTDPEKEHMLYFYANLRANPPSMAHGGADACQVKFMESLPLMRLASGSVLNNHVDPVWMATALHNIGPDGLFYWPSFPWAKTMMWQAPCPEGEYYALPLLCGRVLGAMTVYMLRDSRGPWKKATQGLVDALCDLAIQKGNYIYFQQGAFLPGRRRVKAAPMPVGIESSLVGWTIQGLAQYHRVTGYEPAINLAAKLSVYLRNHGRYFGPNGEFLPNCASAAGKKGAEPPNPFSQRIHFQHHTIPLQGMLDHGLAVGDRNLCEFVRQSFLWAKNIGNTTVGYFPENVCDIHQYYASEICEVAGMIGLALKLSAGGFGDYWDDADRWIRNMFAEGQIRRSDWMYRMHLGGLLHSGPLSVIDPVSATCDRVPERHIGAFAGWPTANDLYAGYCGGIQHCCTGNGTRALYYIWEHMLTHDRGTLSVNLLLNRPSKWADVKSHIPYTGRVDVSIKQDCSLRVRIPEWVAPQEATCRVNDRTLKLRFDGRYAVVGKVKAKDAVQMTFPIGERIVGESIEKQYYYLTLRGNEVVNIDPPGRFCPLYQRDHYRENATCWKKVSRFVPGEALYW